MARRVNNKFVVFLVSLSAAVLLIGTVGIYLHKTTHNANYKQLEAEADQAIHDGDLEGGGVPGPTT